MKSLIHLTLPVLLISFFCFIFYNQSIAFTITSSPSYISEGTNGHSIILELSYTNEQFDEVMQTLKDKPVVVLIDESWFTRSTKQIKLLEEYDFEIGLLLNNDASAKEIKQFKERVNEYFNTNVIWAGCSPTICTEQILNYLHSQNVNTLAISSYIEESNDFANLPNGSIIGLRMMDQSTLNEKLMQDIKNYPFLSIEDNLFRLSIKSEKKP